MQQPPSKQKTPLLRRSWMQLRTMQEEQVLYLRSEFSQVHGLIPLLMKHRNGQSWSSEDRELLMRKLRAISNTSPVLVVLVMPGGVFMLPVLAWWLDRRRNNHRRNAH